MRSAAIDLKNRVDTSERPASLRKGFFSYRSLSIVFYRLTRFILDDLDREYDQAYEDNVGRIIY